MALALLESQIAASLTQRSYLLALLGTLCVPDMAGAISSDQGVASRQAYIDWYERWVRQVYVAQVRRTFEWQGSAIPATLANPFTGAMCYAYRCAMLHQGRSDPENLGYSQVLFLEPDAPNNGLHMHNLGTPEVPGPLILNLVRFCTDMLDGLRTWQETSMGTEPYERNMAKTLQRDQDGVWAVHFRASVVT